MTSNDTKGPPIAQTLSLLFENNPTWGDLIWFAEQIKASGIDLAKEIILDYDDDPDALLSGPIGISFFTHPDPAELLDRDA